MPEKTVSLSKLAAELSASKLRVLQRACELSLFPAPVISDGYRGSQYRCLGWTRRDADRIAESIRSGQRPIERKVAR